MVKDYRNLKSLLEQQECFPVQFMHKFIGRNSPRFAEGVARFEKRFPQIKLRSTRKSSGEAHVALTYTFEATDADEIIGIIRATGTIDDVLVIL